MVKYIVLLICGLLSFSVHSQTYSEWVEKSASAVEKKDYAAAELALKKAMELEPASPENVMLLTNLGTIQRYEKKYDDALVSYGAVLARYPDNAALLMSRANLYCEMGKWSEALLDYNHIISTDKNNYSAYAGRALIFMHNKSYLDAYADYSKMEELKPAGIEGKLGKALILKREQKWSDAEDIYTDLIYRHHDVAILYVNRAECYLNLDKLARTQQDIEKAIELKYNDPYIYFLRGQLRLKQFDNLSALTDFQKAKTDGYDASLVDEYIRKIKK